MIWTTKLSERKWGFIVLFYVAGNEQMVAAALRMCKHFDIDHNASPQDETESHILFPALRSSSREFDQGRLLGYAWFVAEGSKTKLPPSCHAPP